MTMSNITTEQFWQLSPQDREFYREHKDDMDMCVVNGKLHFKVYNNRPNVTWSRFQELLQLKDNLTPEENEALHISSDFNDWNPYGRPYAEHGFYYWLIIDASAYSLEKLGVDKNTKEWLEEWLLAHDFTPEEAATVHYSGGIGGYSENGERYSYKDYAIEIRCRFTDIPPTYIPTKVHKWVKRNKAYESLIFRKEQK